MDASGELPKQIEALLTRRVFHYFDSLYRSGAGGQRPYDEIFPVRREAVIEYLASRGERIEDRLAPYDLSLFESEGKWILRHHDERCPPSDTEFGTYDAARDAAIDHMIHYALASWKWSFGPKPVTEGEPWWKKLWRG